MQARVALVAALAALAGGVLMWIAAPDTSAPVAAPPPIRAIRAPAPPPPDHPAPRAPAERAERAEHADRAAVEPPPAAVRPPPRVPDEPTFDRDAVQAASMQGLASAALARRADVIACWEEHASRYGEPTSRFTLELSIHEDASGAQAVTARLPMAETDVEALDACLDEAFADARFEPLDGPAIRVLWPVPMPRN